MHAPVGHALMGWVPYPPHMGPHFVGPIVGAQRAPLKKKKSEGEGTEPELNLGQNQCEPKQYLRLNLQSATKNKRRTGTIFSKIAKIPPNLRSK